VFDLELFDEKTDNALRERCWGTTAEEVSRWAGAFLVGLQEGGVAACPKHFPGLGAARLDSHEKLPVIERGRDLMLAEDLRPYADWQIRLSAVMVGHACYPAWEPDGRSQRPASLSRAIMTDLLRARMGYDGLVVTDDMEMGAIGNTGSFEQAVVQAVAAGADMVLVCHRPEKILAAHGALVRAVEQGRLAAEQLAQSQERIRRFRRRWLGT
jgi:beta-N-acetylhexosaminidase